MTSMGKIDGRVRKKRITKYGIFCLFLMLMLLFSVGCDSSVREASDETPSAKVELFYAEQFTIENLSDGYRHISVADGNEYILVPKGKEKKDFGIEKPSYIEIPCENIYLAASSAMDLFQSIGSLESIRSCSTSAKDYSLEAVKEKIEKNEITYVGKYSAPDYELLMGMHTGLAIESTMIYHNPKVKEQLEGLGVPVFVERSSYEASPLARLEWIKIYGILTGREKEANDFFEEERGKIEQLQKVLDEERPEDSERKSVAFFYITSNGYVSVRKPGDYICKMIEMAGGKYRLDDILVEEENALSTMNINWEDFYREAVDADILIYNSTIDGGIESVDELLRKNELFRDFKAVKENNVWCTGMNMFQETGKPAEILYDLYHVIKADGEKTEYLNQLKP